MESTMAPIFSLRAMFLRKLHPAQYSNMEKYVLQTSLAAQDYVLSGMYREYDIEKNKTSFKKLPGYVAIHEKYNIPYDPDAPFNNAGNMVGTDLVMNLAWALNHDINNEIVDPYGEFLYSQQLMTSEVLHVPHTPVSNKIPRDILKTISPLDLQKLLVLASQRMR